MKAYAIADTDGGRHEPVPLLRYIFASLNEAYHARSFRGFDAQHYPVIEVEVNVQQTGNGNDAA